MRYAIPPPQKGDITEVVQMKSLGSYMAPLQGPNLLHTVYNFEFVQCLFRVFSK